MGGRQRDRKNDPATAEGSDSADERNSPQKGAATADGGYPEQHGPRFDADGWGEANPSRTGGAGTGEPDSQGQEAGERSFDHGPDDPAAEQAASEAALREPGGRGAVDARPATARSSDEASPGGLGQAPNFDGRQRDYGQGGGQGYAHTGKPGAPGPGSKSD